MSMSVGEFCAFPVSRGAYSSGMAYRQYLVAQISANPDVPGDSPVAWANNVIWRADKLIEALNQEKSGHG